nr:MAG TPA: hypothetical protein [Caudoviricetes sp.]
MRTYMMKDKIKDIHGVMDKVNEEIQTFTDIKGSFILLPHLTMDSLDVLGATPAINTVKNQKKFTEDTDWDNMKVTKHKSCLKKVRKQVRTSWK